MLPGGLSWSLSTGWRLILRIRRTLNIWFSPPRRSFGYKAGGKGDLSDYSNAAAPSCWKSDQVTLTISSVSEMYPTAVICLCWAQDSFCVARGFWLPCQISNKSRTLAILCNILSSTSALSSEWCALFIVSDTTLSPAIIPSLARASCPTTTFVQRVSPVVFDCLQPITPCTREKLAFHSDTMWYDGECIGCLIGEIGVYGVRLLLLAPPVGYVR